MRSWLESSMARSSGGKWFRNGRRGASMYEFHKNESSAEDISNGALKGLFTSTMILGGGVPALESICYITVRGEEEASSGE